MFAEQNMAVFLRRHRFVGGTRASALIIRAQSCRGDLFLLESGADYCKKVNDAYCVGDYDVKN